MRYMRSVSLRLLGEAFAPGQRVLEIGCGTGVEAVALAKRGVHVVATDPSAEMLAIAAERLSREGLGDQVSLVRLPAGDLGSLAAPYGEAAFDGAYSSFGPLNGESDLTPVTRSLAHLVRPEGLCVLGVMNRYYLFETLWYLAHLQPREALRRWSGQSDVAVSTKSGAARMRTWYHTASAVQRAFAPAFAMRRCRALPLLLPPPYLAGLWDRWPGLWQRLVPWEDRLAARWPWNRWGDHVVLELVRQQDGHPGATRAPAR
jgi:SAM-dependent methyltransferase